VSASAASTALSTVKPFGIRAKQAAYALVFKKEFELWTHGQDKYWRTLADVILRDGINQSWLLVVSELCAKRDQFGHNSGPDERQIPSISPMVGASVSISSL
jgi:endonuclease YncB( thermonuclease family)